MEIPDTAVWTSIVTGVPVVFASIAGYVKYNNRRFRRMEAEAKWLRDSMVTVKAALKIYEECPKEGCPWRQEHHQAELRALAKMPVDPPEPPSHFVRR